GTRGAPQWAATFRKPRLSATISSEAILTLQQALKFHASRTGAILRPYAMLKCRPSVPVVFLVAFSTAAAQSPAKRPGFGDYVVPRTWSGKAAPISLAL